MNYMDGTSSRSCNGKALDVSRDGRRRKSEEEDWGKRGRFAWRFQKNLRREVNAQSRFGSSRSPVQDVTFKQSDGLIIFFQKKKETIENS